MGISEQSNLQVSSRHRNAGAAQRDSLRSKMPDQQVLHEQAATRSLASMADRSAAIAAVLLIRAVSEGGRHSAALPAFAKAVAPFGVRAVQHANSLFGLSLPGHLDLPDQSRSVFESAAETLVSGARLLDESCVAEVAPPAWLDILEDCLQELPTSTVLGMTVLATIHAFESLVHTGLPGAELADHLRQVGAGRLNVIYFAAMKRQGTTRLV